MRTTMNAMNSIAACLAVSLSAAVGGVAAADQDGAPLPSTLATPNV